jgi:multiple antibiotic resistance protein
MDIEFYKTAFLTLFVALDPPGLAPIFIALTAQMPLAARRSTAYRSVLIAFGILAGAAIAGEPLLKALGISMPAFRIAGGLLLFYIAAEMVFERREERKSHTAETCVAEDHFKSIAAFPLAIPLMAGPGAITATILQASIAQKSYVDFAVLIAIIFAVLTSCLMVFLMSEKINNMLGTTGRVVLSRLLGVLLAAMAVQIIGDGVMRFRA